MEIEKKSHLKIFTLIKKLLFLFYNTIYILHTLSIKVANTENVCIYKRVVIMEKYQFIMICRI